MFENNIVSMYGDRGKAWLARLPLEVERWARLWGLRELRTYDNLSINYVLTGFQGQTPVVLKLGLKLEHEATALEAFAGHGAIAVVAHQENALLLQRAVPGTMLKKQPQAIKVACHVMRRLHLAPIPLTHNFPHMRDWLASLEKDWNIPKDVLQRARKLNNLMLPTSDAAVLLHGDLHQENILSHGEDWLVIDPKGVIGQPIDEVWACVEDPEHDLKYISHYFGYSFDEVVKRYYVHLILAACWCVEDNLDPQRFLNLAQSILRSDYANNACGTS
jgi:streptomycin 6-kinase